MSDLIERLFASDAANALTNEAGRALEAQQAEITRLREALAGRCVSEERYRSAASKALHILRYCPDKQKKAEAILAAALEQKP